MADENFHEIQLSGKQLVFLFMATVVLAVIVFLLGVSVGRGVRSTSPQAAATEAGAAPTATPPPTQPAPGDLDYHEKLVGRGGDAKPPATPPAAPPATAPPPAAVNPPPAAANTPPNTRGAAPVKPATPPATSAPPPAAPPNVNDGWKVQVGAFNSKSNAEALVSKLKAQGYAAFMFNAAPPSLPYHVRVGPFSQRADAVKAMNALQKEGQKGSKVIR